MTGIPPGTRVRVNFEASYLEAQPLSGYHEVAPLRGNALFVPVVLPAFVTVEAIVPTEPPEGSVVLDRDGDAWQRGEDFIWGSPTAHSRTWAQLHPDRGPLRVIWTPEDDFLTGHVDGGRS